MKLKNTLLLLALLAGAIAYVKWVENRKPTSDALLLREKRPAQFVQEKVTGVTIRNRDTTIQFSQKNNVWRIESPIKDRAQDFDLKGLLSGLELLDLMPVSDKAPSREQLKEYGLLKPEFSVKVDEPNEPLEIVIGNESPAEGTYYLKVEGRDKVYLAQTSVRETLAKKVDDWRNRTLAELSPTEVAQVNIKTAQEGEVTREIEIKREGRYWSLTKPLKARADLQSVNDVISEALTAQVRDFIPDAKDLGAYGLNEPRATIAFLPGEKSLSPVVLEIGAAKVVKKDEKKEPEKSDAALAEEEKLVYVKITGRGGVVTVPAKIENLVNLRPDNVRDQNIMRVQELSVNRLTIEPAGKEKIVLEKRLASDQMQAEWVRKVAGKGDALVNQTLAAQLLANLTLGKSARFIADMSSDLKGFGLDQPQLAVSLSDFSSENTPETNAGEHEQARLLFGRTDGTEVYAKLSDEPFIFTVPKALLEQIVTDPILWQPINIENVNPEQVVALEIKRIRQAPLNLVRQTDGTWKLAKGDGVVNQNAVQTLANTIAQLRAVRWVGPTNAAIEGLDNPNLVVSYTLADKRTGKVTVGSMNTDKMWSATAEGLAGTFQMTSLDFDALNAAIIESPKPAPDSAPAPSGSKPPVPPIPPAPEPPGAVPPDVPPAVEPPKENP